MTEAQATQLIEAVRGMGLTLGLIFGALVVIAWNAWGRE